MLANLTEEKYLDYFTVGLALLGLPCSSADVGRSCNSRVSH
jgi:hypothetical protein